MLLWGQALHPLAGRSAVLPAWLPAVLCVMHTTQAMFFCFCTDIQLQLALKNDTTLALAQQALGAAGEAPLRIQVNGSIAWLAMCQRAHTRRRAPLLWVTACEERSPCLCVHTPHTPMLMYAGGDGQPSAGSC